MYLVEVSQIYVSNRIFLPILSFKYICLLDVGSWFISVLNL